MSRAPDYDICVVGAGAAGCVFASRVDRAQRLLVVDASSLPRNKPCSGVVVHEGIEVLRSLGGPIPNAIFLPRRDLDFVYWDWTHDKSRRVPKSFWNTDRAALDAWLLEGLADHPNVQVMDRTRLLGLRRREPGGHWMLQLRRNGTVRAVSARFVVGCDGAKSVVRRHLAGERPQACLAIQELIETRGPTEAYFIYDDAITDWYGWVIPKGSRTDVGIAADAHRGRIPFERFKGRVEAVMGLRGSGVRRSALLSRLRSKSEIHLGTGRILLAGEAAGLVSPSSGEGISYALRSALLAAAAFEHNPSDPLTSYRAAAAPLLERLARKLAKAAALRVPGDRLALFASTAAPN